MLFILIIVFFIIIIFYINEVYEGFYNFNINLDYFLSYSSCDIWVNILIFLCFLL